MKEDEIRNKISNQEDKVPCLYCPLNVLRSDMPRVGVCKICYVKAKKDGTENKYHHLETWHEFFNNFRLRIK